MKKSLFITIMLAGTASAAFASTGKTVHLEDMYGDVEIVNSCAFADWCVKESSFPHLQVCKTIACSSPGEWNFVNAAAKFRIHMGCVTPDFEIAFGPYAEITSWGREKFILPYEPKPAYVSPSPAPEPYIHPIIKKIEREKEIERQKKIERERETQTPQHSTNKPAKGDPKRRH